VKERIHAMLHAFVPKQFVLAGALVKNVLAMAMLTTPTSLLFAEPPGTNIVIRSQPLHAGRVNPRLFGNFIELLDDVAPGLWAEMLNDRSFEGVVPCLNPFYYDGTPNFCDREWDRDPTWTYDAQNPFNGARCAKLAPAKRQPASLTQSALAVKKGMKYLCSGWFRADHSGWKVAIILKTRLPNGDWMTLASWRLPSLSRQWQKYSAQMISAGETDRAVFELRVEGDGHVWADKLSLMPTDNVNGWRRDVVDAIKDLHPTIVRWGGSVCDPGAYRWKNGIGDRDARTPFVNKNWGRLDPNDVGIDEFCQLCEATGVEPLVCLSFSDGPQSAADLVDYCNGSPQTRWGARRAANGHPAPYSIRYWQIGNEISGDDPKYLSQFGAFIDLMRKVDPSARFLSSYPSQKLLDRAGKDISYVCPHHYTRDFEACEVEFNQIAEMLRRTPGCEHVRIAVTEWNESGGEWGLRRGRQMTLQNALLNARYLNLLMRHSDNVEIACRSSMANSFCGGLIETSPFGLLKRPGYYALQLYARHAQPVPLRVDQPKGGPDIFACKSEDKRSVVVFAVNSKAEPVDCSFDFDGFDTPVHSVKADVLCDTLDARQPEAMNHWEKPERIKVVPLAITYSKVTLPAYSVAAIHFGGE